MKDLLDFQWRWYTWVALLLLLAWFPLGLIMPEHWGWENGILETLQMIFLLFGAYASFQAAQSFSPGHRMRKFWYWTIAVWGIVFARELSFGRSFYPYFPAEDGGRLEISFWGLWRLFFFSSPWEKSPTYIPREEIMFGDGIYIGVFLLVAITLFALFRYFDWKNVTRVIKIPVFLVIFFLLAERSVMVIESEIYPVMESQKDNLEEGAELVGYWCLVFIVFANAFPKERLQDRSTDEKK